jgi:hypothetical protein
MAVVTSSWNGSDLAPNSPESDSSNFVCARAFIHLLEQVNMEDFAVFEPEAQAALGRMVAAMHANQVRCMTSSGYAVSHEVQSHDSCGTRA